MVEIDLISVRSVGIDFVFSIEIGIDLGFAWGSKMTCFFSVWVQMNLFFVSRYRNHLNIRVAIEVDLNSVMRSK